MTAIGVVRRSARGGLRALAGLLCAGLALALTAVLVAPQTAHAKRLVYASPSEFDTLDPHQTFDVGRVGARINLYDGLMRWLDNPPVLHTWLADSYEISKDGLHYTFKIHKGAKFHDGSEITADDFVYSLDRILAIKKGAGTLLSTMISPGGAKAINAHTVEFTLNKPSAIFLAVVPEIYVVNSKLVKAHEKDGDWGAAWVSSHDAGSGSFELTRYDPAVGWIAKRFVDHFKGWGPKYLDEIEYRSVHETNTRVLGLEKGDFQMTDGYLPYDQVQRLRKSKDVHVQEEQSMRIMMMQINNQRAPLSDVHVRRAINYAFDYDGFINNILSGSVKRNPVPIPNNMWGVPKDIKGYTYNLKKAKTELSEAKEKVDRPLTVAYLTGFSQSEQAATLLANGLKKVGVDTKVVGNTWPVTVGEMAKPETSPDIVVYWISTYYADPHNWIGEMFYSGGWGTFKSSSFYKNPKVDKLLEEALISTKKPERAKLYAEAARIVYHDAAGVWIYNTKWYGPYRNNVAGVRFCPIGDGQDMRWVYFK
jgi:peptide/nickel transport system substrate-binding protein